MLQKIVLLFLILEVAKTEAETKLSRQKLEAAKEVSRLETEVDKLKILLRGTTFRGGKFFEKYTVNNSSNDISRIHISVKLSARDVFWIRILLPNSQRKS